MPGCVPEEFRPVLIKAREYMSVYADMEELIRLGAYRSGSDPKVDIAISIAPQLDAFLSQLQEERITLEEGYRQLAEIVALVEQQEGGGE
jgi:flagellum-specific ATP synthase